MEPGTQARSKTGGVVHIGQDRIIPISNQEQADLVEDAITRTTQFQERFCSLWSDLDESLQAQGSDITQENREKVGAAFWMLGEMRDSLNNLLYLTGGLTQVSAYVAGADMAHTGDLRG